MHNYSLDSLLTVFNCLQNHANAIAVRYGRSVLELAKGKYSIEIGEEQALIAALETVKQAVEVSELDAQINATREQVRRVLERSVT